MLELKDIEAFKKWLLRNGHEYRYGKGEYEVLQVWVADEDGPHWAPLWRNSRNENIAFNSRGLLRLVAEFKDAQQTEVEQQADNPHLCPRCKEILRRALEQLL